MKHLIKHPFTLTVDEIVGQLQSNAETGISRAEAAQRIKKYGLNIYVTQPPKKIWLILLEQFKSAIVYLLFAGALISFYFKDIVEGIAILAVIFINALIGFLMELQARRSMSALKKMDVIESNVIRDGQQQKILSENITIGDIVLLEAGDLIPGDGRVVLSNQLQCDESALTGESLPSEKNVEILPSNTELGDQHNMVFKGTAVLNGNGKALIVGIAENTELGAITSLVEKAVKTTTPLDQKLENLSKNLIWLTLILTLLFIGAGFLQGKDWVTLLKTSIALAIAAIPEGLPIVSTVALAHGMLLMAKRNAIVKELSAVETLGSTNVILTDKTGTLTENIIFVDTFIFPEETIKAHIEKEHLIFDTDSITKSKENFEQIKLISALCNNAHEKNNKKHKKATGDPLEVALLHFANTDGASVEKYHADYKRIAEMPFNSDTKIMGTLHTAAQGKLVAAKGSVEDLIAKCSQIQMGATIRKITKKDHLSILAESEKMAIEGLRVLAFAYKESATIPEKEFLDDLTYTGMIAFLDPPRTDIKGAIASCKQAGIQIVMITGDHPLTALNIAKKVGLVEPNEEEVLIGKDLPAMNSLSSVWKKKILATHIFARTTPLQKLEIAGVFQKAGNIVAMTGDGVNDAPALKKADIGIAMGMRGTQVAKETANIILKDDSFKSIVAAVANGRAIFQNIQRFVIYLVSCNLSEIFIVTLLGFISPAATLLPLQILFLNMVTDVFPALALGLGKGDITIMKQPPKDPALSILSKKEWIKIGLYALTMTASVIISVYYCKYFLRIEDQQANNVAFITLTCAQLFHVFNMASVHSKFFVNEITKNLFVWLALLLCSGFLVLVFVLPQMRSVLNLSVLPLNIWIVAVVSGIVPLLVVQGYKVIWKLRKSVNHVND